MANKSSTIKLGREEFASAIRKGLGRTLRHVLDFGLNDVDDLVQDACLHNYCYDTQIESSRASWLFRMFHNSEYYSKFSEAILNSLRTEANDKDLGQLCALAGEMAKQGNANARQTLRESVFEKASDPSSDDWMGRHVWVGLEGAQGFLELARIYGQRLLQDPEDFVPEDIMYSGETESELRDILFKAAETDPHLKGYKDYLETRGVFKVSPAPIDDRETWKQQYHERIRKELSLEGILEDAKNKVGTFLGRYMRFGKHATPEELEKVYEQLFRETDQDVLLRLLWVFRRTPMPRLHEMIFRWANGSVNELRSASINALAQVSDERIHNLAISKARAGQLLGADNDSLDLFLNNFEDNDIPLITEALYSLKPDTTDAHSLGYSILDLARKWAKNELAEVLEWVYENTPCSNCRRRVIEQLYEWKKLDDAMLYECQFDTEEDIRGFALQILNKNND